MGLYTSFDREAYDYGTGWARVMDALEQRFGRVNFGVAGGCVNMVIDTESGHRLNITNADECWLAQYDQHDGEHDGFSVGMYTREAFNNGETPILTLTAYVDKLALPDLIETVLRALVAVNATDDN